MSKTLKKPERKNVTENKDSVAYALLSHKNELNNAVNDEAVSAKAYKEMVLVIISEAKDTDKKKSIVRDFKRLNDKSDICFYIWNLTLKSENHGVIK